MNAPKWTPGPWEWIADHAGRPPFLATPNRGQLYVMDFVRKGHLQFGAPRFAQWDGINEGEERGRRGGILYASLTLPSGRLHPDAAVIRAAPDLAEACEAAWQCIGELPPTQARAKVVQMLATALAKARGET